MVNNLRSFERSELERNESIHLFISRLSSAEVFSFFLRVIWQAVIVCTTEAQRHCGEPP